MTYLNFVIVKRHRLIQMWSKNSRHIFF